MTTWVVCAGCAIATDGRLASDDGGASDDSTAVHDAPDECVAAPELCNGKDDDCDAEIDEAMPVGEPCSIGLGACARTGMLMCSSNGTGTQCSATAGAPMVEECGNGIDDDCNGIDPACPINDRAAGAVNISAGGTFTADLTYAHDNNWAVSTPELDCGEQGGRDVFYQFTLPKEEVVYVDTFGSDFDSVVRIFRGACSAIGATEGCADDACTTTRSQGAFDLVAGTYCLVVDQFSAATVNGSMQLRFTRGGRSGTVIPAASGTQTGTTTGKVNQSLAGCEASSSQPDVGYAFLTCPNRTYTVAANTCSGTGFDSVVYMRSGPATSSDVACSDDVSGCGNGLQARFTGPSISGANLHWLIVDGFGTTGNGTYSLSYSIQ